MTMQMDFIKRVESELLANSPDLSGLQTQLEKELQISPEGARKLIYDTVAQINAINFLPITFIELFHTEHCNLACNYCFENNMERGGSISPEKAKAAVDLLFDYSGECKELKILHFGGEPVLKFDSIRLVTEYAEEKAAITGKSVSFFMTTNGTLVTEEMAHYFTRHNFTVLVSIDGLAASHNRFRVDKQGQGTFAHAVKGLEMIKKVQGRVGVKMTVMPENVPCLYDDVMGLYSMGATDFVIDSAGGVNWAREEMEAYAEQIRKIHRWYRETPREDFRLLEFDQHNEKGYFGCEAAQTKIAVSVTGDISPCSRLLSLNNRHILAKLGDTRYGLTHLENRFDLVNCRQLRSSCAEKGIAHDYQGGCFASNYEAHGDLFEPSLQDYLFKKIKRSNLPLLQKIL